MSFHPHDLGHTTSVSTGARERPFLRSIDRSSFVPSSPRVHERNHRSIESIKTRPDPIRSSPAYLSLILDRVNAFRRPSRRVTARAEIIVVVDVDVIVIIVASH